MQNCLAAPRARVGGVKNLALGVGRDPASDAFVCDLGKLEGFVTRAVGTMYPAWFPGTPEQRQAFISMYKPAAGGMFAGELRVNVVQGGTDMKVVDEDGGTVEPADLQLGSFVRADLEVVGVWCSDERFGLKYSVPRVVLLRDESLV